MIYTETIIKERDEARNAIVGWENKWKCAIEMAARAEIERDEAREKAERYRLEANAMMLQRDEARREVEHLKDMYRTVFTF